MGLSNRNSSITSGCAVSTVPMVDRPGPSLVAPISRPLMEGPIVTGPRRARMVSEAAAGTSTCDDRQPGDANRFTRTRDTSTDLPKGHSKWLLCHLPLTSLAQRFSMVSARLLAPVGPSPRHVSAACSNVKYLGNVQTKCDGSYHFTDRYPQFPYPSKFAEPCLQSSHIAIVIGVT